MLFTLAAVVSLLSWPSTLATAAFLAYSMHHTRHDDVVYTGRASPLVRPMLRCAHTAHHVLHIASVSSSMLCAAAEHAIGATYRHGAHARAPRRRGAHVQLGTRSRISSAALLDSDSD